MNMAKNLCKQSVETCRFTSPVGYINVTACSFGLHTMGMENDLSDKNFLPSEKTDVQIVEKNLEDQMEVMQKCHVWLQCYFDNIKNLSQVPRPDICAFKQEKQGFRVQVWKMLADTVGPGEVITYGALASRLNNPGAVRAVGSAMRNNPAGIIVPCHRVVRSNDVGLYHGGTRQLVKLWLLKHEGVNKYCRPEA